MYNLYGDNMDLWEYENKLYKQGINYIGGVDEVGRGPLVGPVVAACCVLPKDFVLEGLTDSKIAMKQAISKVEEQIDLEHVLIDAMPLDLDIPTTSIIKGDSKSISIAAASVLAKVTRDSMMYELDKKYPQYGYASHKGYPTKKHLEAIHKYGLIEGYRKTYGPVREILEGEKCK